MSLNPGVLSFTFYLADLASKLLSFEKYLTLEGMVSLMWFCKLQEMVHTLKAYKWLHNKFHVRIII